MLLARAPTAARRRPIGNASQEGAAAPHGVYPCAGDDRWIAITVFSDAEWRGFVAAMGRPAWALDARFATRGGTPRARRRARRRIAAWTRARWTEHVATSRLQAHGVAAGLVANAEDLCARDPQLAARGHFVDVPTPEGRTVRIDGPPFLLSETPARVRGPGPLLGEHTDEVLGRPPRLHGPDELAALQGRGRDRLAIALDAHSNALAEVASAPAGRRCGRRSR